MDRLDRENELLEQIKSAPGDANFVLAQRMALKGREMKLQGLCVSSIIQHRAVFAAQPNSFSGLPGSLVQLLFDQTMAHFERLASTTELLKWSTLRFSLIISDEEWGREFQAFMEQLLQTGRVTQVQMDVDHSTEMEFPQWLISAAAVHCPKLEHLCVDTKFCLGQDGSCILDHTNSQHLHKYIIPTFPLERLQHLTRLTLRLRRNHEFAACLVRVIEALPKLRYLDCWDLNRSDHKSAQSAHFVALVQPLLQQNQRVLEVKSMTLELPDLQVDLSSNLRVQKLQLFWMEKAHLSRLRHLSGVRALQVLYTDLQTCYSLVELLGPRGLKTLVMRIGTFFGRELVDLLRVFAAAPELSDLKVEIVGGEFPPPDEIKSPTKRQLGAINFERMKCFSVQGYRSVSLSNHFLPYLEQFVLRAECHEDLILEQPEQIELVLRLLKTHPECCTRVQKLSISFLDEVVADAAVEVASRIALRSPTLKEIVDNRNYFENNIMEMRFPWFLRLLSSNGIRFSHPRSLLEF